MIVLKLVFLKTPQSLLVQVVGPTILETKFSLFMIYTFIGLHTI